MIDLLFAFLHLETKIASSFPICVIGREGSDAAWKWSDSASSAYMTGATKAVKKKTMIGPLSESIGSSDGTEKVPYWRGPTFVLSHKRQDATILVHA